jgi:hypothetical protein
MGINDGFLEQTGVVIAAVAGMLWRSASPTPGDQPFEEFESVAAPGLGLVDYGKIIAKYSKCSPESCVLSLAYIHKFLAEITDFTLSVLNVHRLLLTSMAVAAKFLDDIHLSNSCYAVLGGVSAQELNMLEMKFLEVVQWRLNVHEEGYERLHAMVLEHASSNHDAMVLNQASLKNDAKHLPRLLGREQRVLCDIGDICEAATAKDVAVPQRRRCRQSLSPSERRQRMRAHWFGV